MAIRNWDSQRAKAEMARLTEPGILGFYTHCEVTEVFAARGRNTPFNIFTVLVAEERLADASEAPHLLNTERIKLKKLSDWNLGVNRYLKPIAELVPLFDVLCETKEWRGAGKPLKVGNLESVPTQFVPPDNFSPVPLNRVLKNNFWNGSHVFEWADTEKSGLHELFDDPPLLQDLSEAVRQFVPVGLASLSDRLGNIVVQLPVTLIMSKFSELRMSGNFTVSLSWNPKASPRPLQAVCGMKYDEAIPAFNSVTVEESEALIPLHDGHGLPRALLWDDENKLLLAATGQMSFFDVLVLNTHIVDPEPRVFVVPDGQGGEKTIRFGLTPKPIKTVVGEAKIDPVKDWTRQRMYREENERLRAELRFVQYKPQDDQNLHEAALNDVRRLINQHGEDGVWLWDPYLSAEDVINTLFYCRFFGAELRALTGGDSPPAQPSRKTLSWLDHLRACAGDLFPPRTKETVPAALKFASEQWAELIGLKSNLRGLNLEFRIRTGSAGWPFHDRFLIFPAAGRGALAWSLGTSVNSLGKRHHILQRVDDGQRIKDSFADLWQALDQPEHLIWKTP
jgi:hypothetical protein